MAQDIVINVVDGDAVAFTADVLAVKYAQAPYGVDEVVAMALERSGADPEHLKPRPGGFRLLESDGAVGARYVLLVGVVPLYDFGYVEVRDFSRRTLAALASGGADAHHVALTLHGAGYGLDEGEAFDAEVAGLVDAVHAGDIPSGLKQITFVELDQGRATRLRQRLADLLPEGLVWDRPNESGQSAERLRAAGYGSKAKPHVFVAMPFSEALHDTYHYGIQGAVHRAGFLCERADLSSFVGDVMDWVKRRIEDASLVIADLSGANPNVYLEVGYAWACGVPTVLLVSQTEDLKFDVRGRRCLVYKSIKQLEDALAQELSSLRSDGMI